MPKLFEPSEPPRLITPQELAVTVRLCRAMRSWTQENLADAARIDVRTVQRVEAGGPSDLQTRRGLARAFGAPDIDVFNKPKPFLSLEQHEERQRQEEEKHRRDFVELPLRTVDGEEAIEAAARADAFTSGVVDGLKVTEAVRDLKAEIEDYIRDSGDIAAEIGASGRRDLANGLDDLLKRLAAQGMSLGIAERQAVFQHDGGQQITRKLCYAVVCRRGQEPKTVTIPRRAKIAY